MDGNQDPNVQLKTEQAKQPDREGMQDEEIQQMLVLATRLRELSGGDLDDDAIFAVAEATGAPVEYVRLAVRSVPEKMKRRSPVEALRSSFLAFPPDTRRTVSALVLGLAGGFFWYLAKTPRSDFSGLPDILAAAMMLSGVYNAALSRSTRMGVLAGGVLGSVSQISLSLFAYLFGFVLGPDWSSGSNLAAFLFTTFCFAMVGGGAVHLLGKFRKNLGLSDPTEDRHQLLHQLLEIQNKLRSDERHVTFMSLDIVGSTRMKATADPLAVEYTFNEYHRYVETLVAKHAGQIHSTAGDGVTAVFDSPADAFAAGKAIQGSLFEFNAFRNQLGEPVELRAAIHTGTVLAPGQEVTAVNFAHVIDVAAHLQKLGPTGSLVVSQTSALELGGLATISSETLAYEDIQAAVWRPKSRALPPLPAGGPSGSGRV